MKRSPSFALLCASVLIPCCSTQPVEEPPFRAVGEVDDLRRLEWERSSDPRKWEPFLRHGDVEVRMRVYRAAGRLGERFPAALLREHASRERDPRVLTAALFAWSHRGGEEARAIVAEAAANASDARVRAAAQRGLAFLELPLARMARLVVAGLSDDAAEVRVEAARTAGRFAAGLLEGSEELRDFTKAISPLLRDAIRRDLEPEVRVEAARALASRPTLAEGSLPLLLSLAREFEVDLRLAAVRALAAIDPKPEEVRDALVDATGDGDWRVATLAARSLRGHLDAEGRLRLRANLELATESRASSHVRAAVTDALADDAPTWPILREQLGDVSRTVRVHSFLALAEFDPASIENALVEDWLRGSDPIQREAAARSLAFVTKERALSLLEVALADEHPLVRAAALEVVFGRRAEFGAFATEVLRRALREGDLGDVGTVLIAFSAEGFEVDPWKAEVERAVARFPGFEGIELRSLRADLLGEETPPEPSVFSTIDVANLDGVKNPRAVLHTNRGAVFVDLDVENAPLHVRNFLNHARAGDYDGTMFHRVVPGFVVQGLDPRGDGFGSCGQRLPNEISSVRYESGSLGMPDAGLDSGGCQVFFTQDAVPRLDERYTVFGRITAGLDVLDRIERGDTCLRVDVYLGG